LIIRFDQLIIFFKILELYEKGMLQFFLYYFNYFFYSSIFVSLVLVVFISLCKPIMFICLHQNLCLLGIKN